MIKYAGGNYTAWFYRRKLIEEMKIPIEDEMAWLQEVGFAMEKNFQIWHHRRCIVEFLSDDTKLDDEMDFLSEIFESDRKNYHAWSYRMWLVERF